MKYGLTLASAALMIMLSSCVKDRPNLPAGPIDLKFTLVKTGNYSGPYCATVTMRSYQLKADRAQGFWYWGTVRTSSLNSASSELASVAYEIKKFDGTTPLGTYGTDSKPFPVVSVAGTTKFKIQYSPAYVWALDDCAGCIGLEDLSYKEYSFASVADGVEYECGSSYDMVLYNSLKP